MEGGGLFNQSFLGGDFIWWIGQVVDESTWKYNILSGKFKNPHSIPGWGRRYKVRILGIHDVSPETIPDEELPWAQVMYPITAGGGQRGARQTPNISQGNFVFGFFMDGQDQQQPVIMGILGNNAQTELATEIVDDVSDTQPGNLGFGGWAAGKIQDLLNRVPDTAIRVEQPTNPEQAAENATYGSLPSLPLDRYGLAQGLPRNANQLRDIASGLADVSRRNDLRTNMGLPELTSDQADSVVRNIVTSGLLQRRAQSQTPSAERRGGATSESSDAVHETSASDTKTEKKYQQKHVLMKPDDVVGSAVKAIQTEVDNLTAKMEDYLDAIGNYSAAVSGPPSDMSSEVSKSACQVSKYMKIIMDKVMEYTNKQMNNELSSTVASLPSSMRYQFGDMKDIITQQVLQQFNGITNGMCGQMEGMLSGAMNLGAREEAARASANNPLPSLNSIANSLSVGGIGTVGANGVSGSAVGIGTTILGGTFTSNNGTTLPTIVDRPIQYSRAPICYAEDLVGQALAMNRTAIEQANTTVIDNLNVYLADVQSQMRGVDRRMATRTRDASRDGAVTGITDEEAMDLTRGGSGYVTSSVIDIDGTGVGTLLAGNVRPGIDTTTGGTGLTVDYTVTTGGAGTPYITLPTADAQRGSGYSPLTAVPTTGAGNNNCTVDITVKTVGLTTGIIDTVTINTAGTGYIRNDQLTITNTNGGGTTGTFTIDWPVGAVDHGSIIVNSEGVGYTTGDLIAINAGDRNAYFTIVEVNDPGPFLDREAANPPTGAAAPQPMSSVVSLIGSLTSSMAGALSFQNMAVNLFPFELPPNPSVADFYTLADGGGGAPDSQLPSVASIAQRAQGSIPTGDPAPQVPFLQPPRDMPDLDLDLF